MGRCSTRWRPARCPSWQQLQRDDQRDPPRRASARIAAQPCSFSQLNGVIRKALEKDRSLRYQHASDMQADLRRLKRDTDSAHYSRLASAGEADAGSAAEQRHASGSGAAIAVAKKHKLAVLAGAIAALVVLGAAAVGVYSLLYRPAPLPFQNFTVTQITNSGKAALTAISPDGKFVLSAMDENGLQSLWLRNVPTGSDTQVIAPSAAHYESLTFCLTQTTSTSAKR